MPNTANEQSSRQPLKLAVLVTGGGRSMVNIAGHIERGRLDAGIVTVISSRPGVGAIERAGELQLPTHVVPRKRYPDTQCFSSAIWEIIRDSDANLVCLAGFMSLLDIPDDFAHRVVNIHPALLPAFGGPGMYGHHVHEAVLASGCKITGCTVHYCDQTYDTGPIIVQRPCEVREDDTPDTLAARVFEQECVAYPQALQLIAQGRVRFEGRRVRITGQSG
ncbi:MAG: phosphoribosylglycinamide formyltransferase [Phycisphaera sp.]|nr:phosphoribosylglycinamide formyltransferase [Phycisphaera sp.]